MIFNKVRYLQLLFSLACFISSPSFSETSTPKILSTLAQGHIVVALGGYQSYQGKTQQINIQDLIGDTFTINDHDYNNALFGLGYFLDGQDIYNANMRYGINAFILAPSAVAGNVIQENLFTNLSYHYTIANYPVYLMAKSTVNLTSNLALVVDVGAGPNFIRTYNFKEGSLDGGVTLPDSLFSANTTPTFSATISAGIKINQFFDSLPLEIGYRYFYLGQGSFKISNNQVLNTLRTGNTYANAIFFATSM